MHDYLKLGYKKLWWYIEQNDYNLYYVENEIYVPLKEFVTALNGAVSYTTKEIMPLYNPLICIDTREQKVTKEQALQMAKGLLKKVVH